MKRSEKKRLKEEEREQRLREREIARLRRKKNRPLTFVSAFFILIFVSLIGYLAYFDAIKSEDFINSPYNTRQDTFSDRVVRGSILSSDGEVLAQTNVSEDGTEERSYPYGNTFAHVVGYDTNGKSGLESEANFQLLSSHEFFLNQIRNEFMGTKNTGDSVVSTLSADLQTTAYNSLGDRRGAVVALEPSTGRILAMVSKPDFDPNTISENWDSLVNDETNSSLLNRATMGQYPPGSTFKVVTALDYFRTHGSFNGFSFDCQGSITKEEHTIQCYNGNVHGTEDFYTAFANSCNCAFAEIMTEDRNRMISVDGGSHYRYPSIDAQSAEITITKVQLGYMCMPDSEGSDTEAVLIPVWDFYGTWTSKEPEYEYGNGDDGPVIGDVTMDDAGVPLLTIDARDGSVIQRIQAGWAASMGSKDIK